MPKKPAEFSFANVHALPQTTSDTVLFANDGTNNPEGWNHFYPYSLAALTFTGVDTLGNSRTLTSVPAFTIIPIPFVRINTSALTGSFACLVPKQPSGR